jgi:hypothetical protein
MTSLTPENIARRMHDRWTEKGSALEKFFSIFGSIRDAMEQKNISGDCARQAFFALGLETVELLEQVAKSPEPLDRSKEKSFPVGQRVGGWNFELSTNMSDLKTLVQCTATLCQKFAAPALPPEYQAVGRQMLGNMIVSVAKMQENWAQHPSMDFSLYEDEEIRKGSGLCKHFAEEMAREYMKIAKSQLNEAIAKRDDEQASEIFREISIIADLGERGYGKPTAFIHDGDFHLEKACEALLKATGVPEAQQAAFQAALKVNPALVGANVNLPSP